MDPAAKAVTVDLAIVSRASRSIWISPGRLSPLVIDPEGLVRSVKLKEVTMSEDRRDGERLRTAAPLFVISCAVGFLIISCCVAYFIVRFFL